MKQQVFEVKRKDLDKQPGIEGEIIRVVDEGKGQYYIYQNGWEPIEINANKLQMTQYEINKQIISQLPDLKDFTQAMTHINQLKNLTANRFYMMYGKEISYFTLFNIINHAGEFSSLGEAVIKCLHNVGAIKAIDPTEDNMAIEIWIIPFEENEATCLYLFPYDTGLVEVG